MWWSPACRFVTTSTPATTSSSSPAITPSRRRWRTLLTAIGADPQYGPGYGFLRDLRASAHPVSAETVIGIIAVVREFWIRLGARRAAILTRHGIDLPAAVAHALAEDANLPLRAFSDMDDALAWLNGL